MRARVGLIARGSSAAKGRRSFLDESMTSVGRDAVTGPGPSSSFVIRSAGGAASAPGSPTPAAVRARLYIENSGLHCEDCRTTAAWEFPSHNPKQGESRTSHFRCTRGYHQAALPFASASIVFPHLRHSSPPTIKELGYVAAGFRGRTCPGVTGPTGLTRTKTKGSLTVTSTFIAPDLGRSAGELVRETAEHRRCLRHDPLRSRRRSLPVKGAPLVPPSRANVSRETLHFQCCESGMPLRRINPTANIPPTG